MRKQFAGLAFAALLLSANAACGADGGGSAAPSASGGTTKVNVGVIPIVDVAPIYLGKEKGFFTKRGIDLSMTQAQGGAVIVPGVVSGEFQFGFSNVTSLMLAQTSSVPIKVVANGVASTGKSGADFGGVAVKGTSPIKSAKEFAGKRVAVNTLKNIGDTVIREAVRKDGGDPKAVKFVEMPFAQMPAALDAGQVDAVFVVEPALSAVKAQGGRVVSWVYADVVPDLTVAVYFTSTKLMSGNPDLVKRFQEAMKESLTYADSHPDEARQVLSTYTKIDAKVISGLTLPKWPTEINRASLEKLAELAQTDGVFAKQPDLDQLLP